jgi:hypothetical protein
MPWLTFLAWIVAIASIILSVIWAIFLFKPGDDDE